MATKVFMPKLGLTMKEGTIVHWLVDEGQPVTAGTILFEVENEKAVHEIDAQVSGVLGPHLLKEGETAIIGTVIAYILEPGETLADLPQAIENEPATVPVTRSEAATLIAKPDREILASPIAKRLAKEKGVDLSTVQGSGPGGRITEADVLNALKSNAESAPGTSLKARREVPFQGVRRVIAERMAGSLAGSAQLTLCREVDATELVQWRNEINVARSEADQVSFNVLFIHLVGRTLSEFPEMNCRLVENTIIQLEMVNIGLAIDTERGLVVPVIKNVDRKSINEIRADVSRLMERVKQNRATSEDLSEGTFTITNLGSFGVDTFTPILNPPECGILGVGRIVQKLVVKEDTGAFMVRRMLNLSITFDHRLIDGAPAARFLAILSRLIENPPKEG